MIGFEHAGEDGQAETISSFKKKEADAGPWNSME